MQKEFEDDGGEWKFQKIESLFDIVSGKQPGIQNRFEVKEDGMVNTITGATTRNGVNFYSYSDNSYNNELTISKDGEYAGTVFLQTKPFIIGGHCMGLIAKQSISNLSKVYISTLINKVRPIWRGKDRPSVQKSRLEKLEIELPFKNGEIAFSYMEDYIKALEAERIETLEAERIETLEAYLTVTNLKDYRLTKNDEKILDRFDKLSDTKSRVEESEAFSLSFVKMKSLFPNIYQGRRLKKDDQIDGMLPFVMAGTTNTGVVRMIGNKVRKFPKHSLTIDIFGNTFYRSYEFGAGDDTGVFWNEDIKDTESLLYLRTVIGKSLLGKHDFGNKLRASQTHEFEFEVPICKGQINYQFMSDFIKVVEKIVIKDLVQWTDKKIAATREVVAK